MSPRTATITAVARAITRGSSLVKSLTFGGDARARSPSDGSGLALPCASLHIGPHDPRMPATPGLQGGADGALGSPSSPPLEADRVTEIPEHLLKRSKERRAAIGGEEAPAARPPPAGEAVEAAPAAPEPAAAAVAATPEPVPVPEPVRPEVAAAHGPQEDPVLGDAGARRPPAVGLRVPGHPRAGAHRRAHPGRGGRRDLQVGRLLRLPRRRRGRERQRPRAHRGARDLARLPRPDDVGAPRRRSAGSEFADTYGATDKPWTAACPPTPPSTTRSWRWSCSTSGSQFGGPGGDVGGVPGCSSRSPRARPTFAEAGLGELSAEVGDPRGATSPRLSSRLPVGCGRTGRLTP